jgi:hypothetical protein
MHGKYHHSASILNHILSDPNTTGPHKAAELRKLIEQGTAGYHLA